MELDPLRLEALDNLSVFSDAMPKSGMPSRSGQQALEMDLRKHRIHRLLDPDEALRRLETRLGPLHAQLRLGIEREREAQAFGQGLSFLRLENLPLMQTMIEISLRVTGLCWRGRANAGKVRVRPNTVELPGICATAFEGFTILHLSDLHADLSGPAMQRAAESHAASIMISVC